METFLEKIVDAKLSQLSMEMAGLHLELWQRRVDGVALPPIRDFRAAVSEPGRFTLIAEIKKASPSKGLIRPDFDPVAIAKAYEQGGVDAVSVLTEREFFGGSDRYLTEISQTVRLPILRKDFIIDLRQIYQARLIGADAVLLIAALLDEKKLVSMQQTAASLGLHCLVEVHNEKELSIALGAGATLIGINNRDLKSFQTDLQTTERLMANMPSHVAVISESGISTAADMAYLRSLGVNGVLVGETLMRCQNIEEALLQLRGKP